MHTATPTTPCAFAACAHQMMRKRPKGHGVEKIRLYISVVHVHSGYMYMTRREGEEAREWKDLAPCYRSQEKERECVCGCVRVQTSKINKFRFIEVRWTR